MLSLNDIKTGVTIILNDEPYIVLSHEHSKMGRAGAVLRTKVRNLCTGAVLEKTFQGADKVSPAKITKLSAQFLYKDSHLFHFMNANTYEQFSLGADVLENATAYLVDGTEVSVLSFNNTPLNIDLPAKVALTVTDAPPNVKGDTQSGGGKTVITETGLSVTVPLFIKEGDHILVNTQRGTYVSKA